MAQAEILAEKYLYSEEPTTMIHHSVDQEHVSTYKKDPALELHIKNEKGGDEGFTPKIAIL